MQLDGFHCLPSVGPVAAQRMKSKLSTGKGASNTNEKYLIPQYCTPVTVKYNAVIAVQRFIKE